MTERIFKNTFLVGILSFLICAAMFMGVMYQYFEERVFSELKAEAGYVTQGVSASGKSYFDGLASDNRVTWVDTDGTVLYDSVGDAASMENHLGRQEIQEAMKNGAGRSVHYSSVFLEKTLYYAERLPDGTVMRVSCRQNTVGSILLGLLSPMCWMLVLVLILSAILASRLAKRITRPINQIDLEDPRLGDDLKELEPLVSRLREQNCTIKMQLDELGKKQREFTTITENMSEGFILIDNKANTLSYNSSALRILESPPEDEGGSVLRLNRSPEFRAAVDAALCGEHGEAMLQESDRSYQLIANPVTAGGQVTGAVLVIMDVTEKEQRDALRREFTANVSHELKTPLTSISGFAELMKDGMVPPDKEKEFAGDIYDESQRLISLVEDIIKLSKLDEGAFPLEKETVDLYAISEDAASRLSPAAEKRNVKITVEGEHATINGVKQILDEMIYNLIDNAIKYNKDGGSVTVSVRSQGAGIRWTVADTGVGIPYASQDRVFERFYRVDKSHSREIGGTGLGLSIVKHGAIYHNAVTELVSTPGEGTAITIVF